MESPGFFTLDFHLKFFPNLLAEKWRESRKPPEPAGFHGFHHPPIEFTLAPFACGILIALGAPGAIDKHSVLGILAVLTGAGGLVALVAVAVANAWSEPLTYKAFSVAVFLFCILLGATAGIFHGFLLQKNDWEHPLNRARGWLEAAAGGALGYPLGIAAGLWQQKLGFLAVFLQYACLCGMVGLVVTDLVVLFGMH